MAHMKNLFASLEHLTQLHQTLYSLELEKKEALLRGDHEQITAISRQEQKLVREIELTEASRVENVQQICADRMLPLAEATLLDLIKLCTDAAEKLRLTAYRDELIGIVSELRKANELNQQLLEQSLSFINLTFDLISESQEDDFIYKKPVGNQVYANPNSAFLNKKA